MSKRNAKNCRIDKDFEKRIRKAAKDISFPDATREILKLPSWIKVEEELKEFGRMKKI